MKKTIIITGSSSGLGYALAKKLSKNYNIIGCGRRKLKASFQRYYRLDLNNPKEVEDFRGGKKKLQGFFVGQLMKRTKGQADPKLANQILVRKLTTN